MKTTNNENLLTNAADVVRQCEDINENTIDYDLMTGATKKGKLTLSYETIDAVSDILTNKFLDYFRNGGDIKNLTPSAIYGRTKNNKL